MLPKCLSVTETVTRCHTPVMLTLASPSIVILILCPAYPGPGQKIVKIYRTSELRFAFKISGFLVTPTFPRCSSSIVFCQTLLL